MSNTHPVFPAREHSFVNQRFLRCIWRCNSTWREFVCGHGGCLSKKRGKKQHRHRPKRTKILNMPRVQCRVGVFQIVLFKGFLNIPHIPPPPPMGDSAGTSEATIAPTKCSKLAYMSVSPRDMQSCPRKHGLGNICHTCIEVEHALVLRPTLGETNGGKQIKSTSKLLWSTN